MFGIALAIEPDDADLPADMMLRPRGSPFNPAMLAPNLCEHIDQAGDVFLRPPMRTRLQGDRLEAARLEIPAGPDQVRGLDQGEEPGRAVNEARGGRGMGAALDRNFLDRGVVGYFRNPN
jgi:hypothetical protein